MNQITELTGKEHFDNLPIDVQEKFKANYESPKVIKQFFGWTFDQYLNYRFHCKSDFIGLSFLWDFTPEGGDYWNEIAGECERLKKKK